MNKHLYINQSWNFKETFNNLYLIKDDYTRILSSFLWYELKERNQFMRECKDKVYSLTFEIWKRDRIWEYLNDNLDFEVLSNML